VSGTVFYSGRQTGTVWVIAVTASNSWSTNCCKTITGLGAYQIPNLAGTSYWIKAWMDSNGNGTNNAVEAWGSFSNSAVLVTNRVTGKNITLSDPDNNTNSMPDWWEVKYFGSTTNSTGSGDPDGDQYTNLEEYQADTDPTNTLSHPWNISGTITYAGPQTGVIHIVACSSGTDWEAAQFTTNAEPGSYTITHLPPNAYYWVKAWRDTNGDGSNTFWEAWGAYANNSVYLGPNATGVDITLADPDSDGDTLPDWWEVRYGFDPLNGGGEATVAWWKLDETGGTNAADATANANNGLVLNASNAWIMGTVSNALLLDGTNDYVEVPDSASLKPSTGVSVALWLKPSRTYTNGTAYFLSKQTPGGATGYSLGYENGALAFTICASGVKTLRFPCALTSDIPVHVAGTFSSSNHRLYVNGAMAAGTNYDWGTGFATLAQGTNTLRLGAASGSTPTNFFSGLLDDVRVCDRDLSSNEVHAVYELGADPDGDGLSNFDEYHYGASPTNSDTDADGLLDGWERDHGSNPSVDESGQTSTRLNYQYDGSGWLRVVTGARSESITLDNEGNVQQLP
ncbi:MAG: LamG-like jellyroll fold domain-containing protein, partial [bacterium]